MAKRPDAEMARLIERLCGDPAARLIRGGDGRYRPSVRTTGPDGDATLRGDGFARERIVELAARGLLVEVGPDVFAAAELARAWLKRRASASEPFRMQHGEVVETRDAGDRDRQVLVNLDESPVASLSRRAGKDGAPWLSADLAVAAERLRRDFEIGRLQPRVTANWSASVNSGRRNGDSSGLADLTDMALAARLRVDRALRHAGPELSGVLIDVCCPERPGDGRARAPVAGPLGQAGAENRAAEPCAPLWAHAGRNGKADIRRASPLGRGRFSPGHRVNRCGP